MKARLTIWLPAFVMALVLGVSCSDSSTPSGPSDTPGGGGGTPADLTITIVGMNGSQSFSPNPGTIRVGQRVAWLNADSVAHTATANGGSFNTGILAPGSTSAAITITAAGSFGYHCTLHPEMVGTLTVNQ